MILRGIRRVLASMVLGFDVRGFSRQISRRALCAKVISCRAGVLLCSWPMS
jgi:hypothetical protein